MMEQDLFTLLVAQTWQVAILAIFAWIAVRLFGKDRPHLAQALWALVLIKCIVPPVLSSPTSPFSWIEARAACVAQSQLTEPSRIDNDIDDTKSGEVPIRPNVSIQPIVVTATPAPKATTKNHSNESLLTSKANLPTKTQANSQPAKPSNFTSRLTHTPPEHDSGKIADVSIVQPVATEPYSMKSWTDAVVWLWIVGIFIGMVVVAIRFTYFLVWLRRSPAPQANQIATLVDKLRHQLGIRTSVKIRVLSRPVGPAVIGLFRPTILLPAAIVEHKSAAEIEPLVAHELIHIRRGDLWWAALQTLATRLLWFHPLVWLASKMVTRESERSCDEETIAGIGCRPSDYARGLLEVLELKHQLRVAPASPGVRPVDITSARLERVMKLGNGIKKRTPLWVWLAMLVCSAAVLPGAAWAVTQDNTTGESEDKPQAEDAAKTPAQTPAKATATKPEHYQEYRFEVGDLLKTIRERAKEGESAEQILIAHCYVLNPDTLNSSPPRGARINGTTLIVNETAERAKKFQFQKALDGLREYGFDQVVVDARFLRLNQEQIDVINLLGIEWEQIKSNSPATEIPIPPTGIIAPIATSVPSLDLPSRDGIIATSVPSLDLPNRDGIHAVSHIARTTPALFSVVSEEELQRIIKISSEWPVSLSHGPTITMLNGRDAEIRTTCQRPFVTAVKEVQVEGKGKARAHQPVISLFETGTRMRVRPVVTPSTIEVDCHLQLKEITDVKVLHLAHWEFEESISEASAIELDKLLDIDKGASVQAVASQPKNSGEAVKSPKARYPVKVKGTGGVSIQSPTQIATNIEIKRSVPLGGTLLLEMLSNDWELGTDTLIVMLTCKRISPPWAKESDLEKKQRADREDAIKAAMELPAAKELSVEENQVTEDEDVLLIQAGSPNESVDSEPRKFEVMGMKFKLVGDVKFEIKSSEILVSGTQLSMQYGEDCVCSCENEGTIKCEFEQNEIVGGSLTLNGNARVQMDHAFVLEANQLNFITDNTVEGGKATLQLQGDAHFFTYGLNGMADRISTNCDNEYILSGNVSLFHNPHNKPAEIYRGDKVIVTGGEIKILVETDGPSTLAPEPK